MTVTGLLLGPLLCLAILLPPGWVIVVAVATTVFADAAVVNAGGRTVMVEWFFGLLIIGRILFMIAAGRAGLRADILRRLAPLLLYALSCAASLLMALAFFQGEVIVLPGSAGLNPLLAEPYRLMPENINQLVYLVLVLLLNYALVHLCGELDLDALARWVDRAMRCACGLAAGLVLWQVASFMVGVWFPDALLHSDTSADAWNQSVAGVRRPAGSFPEPSALVYFFSAHLFYFWQRLRQTGNTSDQLFLTLALGMLLISTATTAGLVLAVFVAAAAIDAVTSGRAGTRAENAGKQRRQGLRAAHVLRFLLATVTTLALMYFVRANGDLVGNLIEQQLVNKGESLSYELRSNADRIGWRILLETGGLGLGLGSHRPSSGLLSLLIGPGLVGAMLFIVFVGAAVRGPGRGSAALASKPIRWALIGPLTCHLVTAPEFHSPTLWIPVALAIGMALKARALPTLAGTGPGTLSMPVPHARSLPLGTYR